VKRWECIVCGFIYDEIEGWPEDGIPAGTRWDDIPDDWLCPDCGMGKDDFEMIEIEESLGVRVKISRNFKLQNAY